MLNKLKPRVKACQVNHGVDSYESLLGLGGVKIVEDFGLLGSS